jgi:integrase
MASIAKIGKRRFWFAMYRDAKGVQRCKSTKIQRSPEGRDPKERAQKAGENRRLAQDIANNMEQAERGNATEAHLRKVLADISERVNNRRMEFKKACAYLTEWKDRASKAKSWRTGLRYKKVVEDFLESLGSKADASLSDITARDIQHFVDSETATGKSASSIRIAAKVLNIPFNRAMRQGLILTNPVPSAELPSPASESREAFTWEQVNKLVETSEGGWKTAIMLAAYTGARLGDVVTMRWAHLDLGKSVLKFRPQKTARNKKDLEIPLHTALREHLLALPSVDDPAAFIMPGLAAQKIPGRSGLSRQFQAIVTKAGIEQETVTAKGEAGRSFNKLSFHSLRHSYISAMANAGIAPDVRQKLSGHADDRSHAAYTHHEAETLRKAIDTLPRLKP